MSDHYKGKIEPIDVIEAWDLDFRLANVVKYIARHKRKGEEEADLLKAEQYLHRYRTGEWIPDSLVFAGTFRGYPIYAPPEALADLKLALSSYHSTRVGTCGHPQ